MGSKSTKIIVNNLINLSIKKEYIGLDQSSTKALTLYAKGDNSYGNVAHCTSSFYYKHIWAENYQCFAVDLKGRLYSWGLNDHYQLGNSRCHDYIFSKIDHNSPYNFVDSFAIINNEVLDTKTMKITPLFGKIIKKVSCGDGFSIFLDQDGILYTCGKGNIGQLGYDLLFDESKLVSGVKCQDVPRIVQHFTDFKVVIIDIICGSDFAFAIDDLNQLHSWGNNNHGQLARTTSRTYDANPDIAQFLTSFEKITKLCCGWMHGCCLTDAGEVYIWGNPFYDYSNSMKDIVTPIKVDCYYKVIDLTCGFHHFCMVVIQEGRFELFTFGGNEFGQLGYDTECEFSLDIKNVEFKENSIIEAVCGAFHTVCRLTDDIIVGFGQNTAECITWPVLWNWPIDKSLRLHKVICGNGYTIIVQKPLDSQDQDESSNTEKYVKVHVKSQIPNSQQIEME